MFTPFKGPTEIKDQPGSIDFHLPDGRVLRGLSWEKSVKVLDAKKSELLNTFTANDFLNLSSAVILGGSHFAIISRSEKNIYVFDTTHLDKPAKTLTADTDVEFKALAVVGGCLRVQGQSDTHQYAYVFNEELNCTSVKFEEFEPISRLRY